MITLGTRIDRLEDQAQEILPSPEPSFEHMRLIRMIAEQLVYCCTGLELVTEDDTDPESWRHIQRMRLDAAGEYSEARRFDPPEIEPPPGVPVLDRPRHVVNEIARNAMARGDKVEAAIETAEARTRQGRGA